MSSIQMQLVFSALLILLLTGCAQNSRSQQEKNKTLYKGTWETDTSKRIVDLSEFKTLLPRDGIPPIDNPEFWALSKAGDQYHEHEPVIVVEHDGKAKAYPISILTQHEIVNDNIGGKPLTITYCPLCNSGMVFERQLNHEGESYMLDFGVSGMLRKSDLVMWDRQTESWWQQITGKALVGELAGAELELYPSDMIAFEDFRENYPEGMVLSTNTGHNREYGVNPYVDYDEDKQQTPRFFKEENTGPLPPLERVVTLKGREVSKVYPYSVVSEKEVINDVHEGRPLVIFFKGNTLSPLDERQISKSRKIGSATVYSREVEEGKVLTFEKTAEGIKDKETGSTWNIQGKCVAGPMEGQNLPPLIHGDHFAFAWFAFHENAVVYGSEE